MGGEATLAAAPEASVVVDASGEARIRPPGRLRWHMAWLQAFCTAAPLASAALGWLAVHWPLKFLHVLGRVERWQSPVDRARLEIV